MSLWNIHNDTLFFSKGELISNYHRIGVCESLLEEQILFWELMRDAMPGMCGWRCGSGWATVYLHHYLCRQNIIWFRSQSKLCPRNKLLVHIKDNNHVIGLEIIKWWQLMFIWCLCLSLHLFFGKKWSNQKLVTEINVYLIDVHPNSLPTGFLHIKLNIRLKL